MFKKLSFVAILFAAATAHAQTAKLSAPEKIAAGSIAVIDMTGSDGDRYDVQVIPSVKPEHLARDTDGKKLFFATCDEGQYAIVLTAHKGSSWALATVVITVGDAVPVDPGEPSDITKASAANVPKNASKAERAKHRKWFNDTATIILKDGLLSKKINVITAKEIGTWTQPWRDHFNATLKALEKANPVTPQHWFDAYSDIAKGIPE